MKETNINNDKNIIKNQNDSQDIEEIGGQKGLEPTRYGGEWEKNGRVSDF